MLFQDIDATYTAPFWRSTIAAAVVRRAAVVTGDVAAMTTPIALEAEAGNADQLELHNPAMLLHLFRNTFWTANRLTAAIPATAARIGAAGRRDVGILCYNGFTS